jgi:hypothetical protein
METDDTGYPVQYVGNADRTVQVYGTFGGATVTLEGSLDGTNWATLNDAQGSPIAITEAKLEAVTELVRYTRPSVSGGSGASLTVMLFMRNTMN